jgi:hypothetical protein
MVTRRKTQGSQKDSISRTLDIQDENMTLQANCRPWKRGPKTISLSQGHGGAQRVTRSDMRTKEKTESEQRERNEK